MHTYGCLSLLLGWDEVSELRGGDGLGQLGRMSPIGYNQAGSVSLENLESGINRWL